MHSTNLTQSLISKEGPKTRDKTALWAISFLGIMLIIIWNDRSSREKWRPPILATLRQSFKSEALGRTVHRIWSNRGQIFTKDRITKRGIYLLIEAKGDG